MEFNLILTMHTTITKSRFLKLPIMKRNFREKKNEAKNCAGTGGD
jgi:hypothetical protein